MLVKNIAGYDVSYKYKGNTITIPFDNQIYSVPNDLQIFEYCKVMANNNKKVKYINNDGTFSDIHTGNKRRGRKKNPKRDKDKPLKGVSIDLSRRMILDLRYFGKTYVSARALDAHIRRKLSIHKDR